MSIYLKSKLIKERRKESGYSREELASGICDSSTLKRYENNGMIPNNSNYRLLQEKMGGNPEQLVFSYEVDFFNDIELYEKYEKLLVQHEYDKVANRVNNIREALINSKSIEATQFIGRIELINSKLEEEKKRKQLEELLKKTVVDYDNGIFSIVRIYNETELNLLNDIAIAYSREGQISKALEIYKRLTDYFDKSIDNSESLIIIKILINYANKLGQTKKYDDAIEISKKCIRIMKRNSMQHLLYNVLFNFGWLYYKMGIDINDSNQLQKAKHYIKMSLALGRYQNESIKNLNSIENFYNTINDCLQEYKF